MTTNTAKSIKSQLIIWLLIVGLLPLILVSVISYHQASKSLVTAAEEKLQETSKEKVRFILNWFDYRWMDLDKQAQDPANTRFLLSLIKGLKQSQRPIQEYIHSYDWTERTYQHQQPLINTWLAYDYLYDIFLIDIDGNILYSVARESDLGTNLLLSTSSSSPFQPDLTQTRFAQAVRHTLESGQHGFSDFEYYSPSNNLLSGFISAPLLDSQGNRIGAFAFQIRLDRINTLLTKHSDQGINHYLVGQDGLIRTHFKEDSNDILKRAIDTEIVRLWQQSLTSPNDSRPFTPETPHSAKRYRNPDGKTVIGVSQTIRIANLTWLLVSEYNKGQALATAYWLGQFVLLLIIISTGLIVAIAIFLSNRLSRPILTLSKAVDSFANTHQYQPVSIDSQNEIGQLALNFNKMIVARERYEHAIQQSNLKAQTALSELKDQQFALSHHAIVAVTDIKGNITFANSKFEEISGYSQPELLGQNHRMLKSGLHPKAFFRNMYLTISSGKVWTGEICNKAKDGHLYWVSTTIAPLRGANGKIDRYIAIRTDITEQKAVQSELQKAKEQAEMAAKAKSEFLASMSHEIRTPMNGVIGMLSLLSQSPLIASQRHQVHLASSSAESLLVIINDILDFSKIEAGRLDLDNIDFNLRTMLGELAESIAYRAQEKNLELILDLTDIEQDAVIGDPGRLRQIVSNLVNNAIKFTHQGEIIIKATLKKDDSQPLQLLCSVSDTGIGIPKDRLQHIFESFTQVDASTTRQYGGTGLGLPIAKQLCRLMGGDITVSSQLNKGSQFQFWIQLEPSHKSQVALPSVVIQGMRILVVDDNQTNRDVLRRQLALWGAAVDVAWDADSAMEAMDNTLNQTGTAHHVAFLDMQMPGTSGSELGKRIRSQPRFNDTKLIMMTSINHRGDANLMEEIGFSGYFPKPTTTEDLLGAIAVIVENGDALANANPLVTRHYLKSLHPGPPRPLSFEEDHHWPTDCRILLVEDNAINQAVVQGLLDGYHLQCDIARNGRAALNMLQESQPDFPYTLALMDCQMPEMDGYETTRCIRSGMAGARYQNLPILAMTANAMKGDREKCLANGMNDYMSKPINQDDLFVKLKTWLSGEALPRSEIEPFTGNDTVAESTPESPAAALPIWDKESALNRVLGKPERLSMLISMFQEDTPPLLQSLRTALNNHDWASANMSAHTLKGTAANLSAEQLSQTAFQLELAAQAGNLAECRKLEQQITLQVETVLQYFADFIKKAS